MVVWKVKEIEAIVHCWLYLTFRKTPFINASLHEWLLKSANSKLVLYFRVQKQLGNFGGLSQSRLGLVQ